MATFKPPQKKKHRGKETISSPFPIPIASITEDLPSSASWSYYNGILKGNHVVVEKYGDAKSINSQGYFGKFVEPHESSQDVAEFQGQQSEVASCSTVMKFVTTPEQQDQENQDKETIDKTCDIKLNSDKIESDLKLQLYQNPILYLSCEESFFLSFALGCLFIKDGDENMDILRQWKAFCELNVRFPVTYAVYHHFRSKGWVPKDGIRYGADLILYKKGTPFYHASYVVVIQTVNSQTLQAHAFNGAEERKFTWASLSGLLRLATTVSKEVMFCYVLVPKDLSQEELRSPQCIRRFQIHEKISSRWVSSKERERELLDIDCDF
ncbi:unnamed protein product [Clavelina lepadiformis]|uniref:tRNA-splicing endonuclease subunit Sen2 n=1 Tax=Clavelina lepadiformis TaxID=159417 RepID=A0ABP0F7C7_CLALP